MQRTRMAVSFILFAALSACGDTYLEKGLLGAGAGATTAMLLGGDVETGALVGAAGNVTYCELYPQQCN